MRSTLLMVMVLLPVLAIINALWFGSELRRFLADVPRLESSHDLERFKRVVGRQMYAALVQIVLLTGPVVVMLYGLSTGSLPISDVIYVIVPALLVIAVALTQRGVELRTRSIPAADELADARDAVVETWLKRPVPDW